MKILAGIFWLLFVLVSIIAWLLPIVGTGYILFVNHEWINLVYIAIASIVLFVIKMLLVLVASWLGDQQSPSLYFLLGLFLLSFFGSYPSILSNALSISVRLEGILEGLEGFDGLGGGVLDADLVVILNYNLSLYKLTNICYKNSIDNLDLITFYNEGIDI